MNGPHVALADLPLAVPFESVKQYEDYIARLHQIPRAFSETEEVLRAGMRDNLVPVRFLLEKVPAQCDGVIKADPFLLPTRKFPAGISPDDQGRLTRAITDAVTNEVLPAYQAFGNFIGTEYARRFCFCSVWVVSSCTSRLMNVDAQEQIMTRRNSKRLLLAALAGVSVGSQEAGVAQQPVERHVVPLKQFSGDHRFETVSGDPTKPGALYVIRIHAEAGYVIMPHVHPEDENIVVVQGSWALGMGDRFNRQALEPMELGTYGFAPKKMAHFALSKTNTIIQVHGVGPFTTQWVVPIYELTDKGVLLETSAAEPGRSAPMNPPGCFVLKPGTRVRGSYGEGVVVGAQCTPGQLTQYQVEKPDRGRYWAQREELNTP
jgi:hypothetical protein